MIAHLPQRLHPDSVKVSRISAVIVNSVLIALSSMHLLLAHLFGWSFLPGWIALGLFALSFVLFVCFVPEAEVRWFSFDIREEELEFQSGALFISSVLVPMVRVQHVEMGSGPLMRKYDLAEVKIVTAATTHKISGLKREDAERIKQRISRLARVVEPDE
ncbi:membrane protein YdbS with pleckstrin-like domain [Paenibacillus mucilaginosus]|uniref:PH domain-containing protein n=1 Tax=Paenibacillus mucilaginosus TaxID=61624 RepID=UPI003D1BB916